MERRHGRGKKQKRLRYCDDERYRALLCVTHIYVSSKKYIFVESLGNGIRAIRQRLKQTMSEFAQMIGTDQSTISRYESGQIVPSKTTLTLLLLLAAEDERSPILEALGPVDDQVLRSRLANAEEVLSILLVRRTNERKAGSDASRVAFAEEAAAIASIGQVDPTVTEFLKLYRKYAANQRFKNALAQMLPYFEFLGSQLEKDRT